MQRMTLMRLKFSTLIADDIGVTSIVSPSSGTLLSNTEQVTVVITNFGGATQSDFEVTFVLNDGERNSN